MKIVDATPKKSKSEILKNIFDTLLRSESDKAAYIEIESDLRRFRKYARRQGYSTKAQKQLRGGWLVWIQAK